MSVYCIALSVCLPLLLHLYLTLLCLFFYSQIARQLVDANYSLVMDITNVEFQFDRKKVTVFYDSEGRVDFREVVRELGTLTPCRVWMRKMNRLVVFKPKDYAVQGLATGENHYEGQ